jgi:hypothetical protein
MNKKQFRQFLLNNKVKQVTIISVPDYRGGYKPQALINNPNYELEAFEYIEFEGDASKALSHHKDLFEEHTEVQYEAPKNYYHTLAELVIEALQ